MIAILCKFFCSWHRSSIYVIAGLTRVVVPAHVIGSVVTLYVRDYLGRGEFSGESCYGVCAARFCKWDRVGVGVGVGKRISRIDLRVS